MADDIDYVARLFGEEVLEIASGTVEIKAIARKPGYRSKLAVFAGGLRRCLRRRPRQPDQKYC